MKTFTKSILIMVAIFFVASNVSQAQLHIRIQASFYSDALDDVKNVDVYLPVDYYVNTEQDYACIYYLHGGGGDQG